MTAAINSPTPSVIHGKAIRFAAAGGASNCISGRLGQGAMNGKAN